MSDLDLQLDHVGVAVATLDQARETYAKLGFTLTARSIHSGSKEPGGPVVPWGSGNHCAMFEQGYLELIGITDPDEPSTLPKRTLTNRVPGWRSSAESTAHSARAFEAPITVWGETALSVETRTNRSTLAAAAVSAVIRVAIALLRIASNGFDSISGTCL